MERHSCKNCKNLNRDRKEVMEGRLKGRYRYGCESQESGYVWGFLASDDDLETLSCGSWHGRSESGKRKTEKEKDWEEYLQRLFDRWNEWNLRGCPEGKVTDGVYLNRLRLAIEGMMKQIEETLEECQYPESYYSPLPPKMDESYMADTASLEKYAKQALYSYKNSPDYLWLESYLKEQKPGGKARQQAAAFLEHAEALEEAISQGEYLLMKQEMRQEGIMAELAKYRRSVQQKKQKTGGKGDKKGSRRGRKGMSGQMGLFEEKAS